MMARDICRMCGIQQKCLAWALPHPWIEGTWGGLDEDERRTRRAIDKRRSAA